MAITAAMVKELREMTGAGMMDCKKALNETNGNMDEAVKVKPRKRCVLFWALSACGGIAWRGNSSKRAMDVIPRSE